MHQAGQQENAKRQQNNREVVRRVPPQDLRLRRFMRRDPDRQEQGRGVAANET